MKRIIKPMYSPSVKYIRLATGAAFATLLVYSIVFTITPACMNEIGRHYNASPAKLAWLIRMMMAGFFISVLLSARYADKHGKIKPLLFGCVMMASGLALFAWAPSFNISVLAVFLAGIGGGSAEGISTALLSDLYAGPKRTSVMNASQAVFGLGAMSAPFAIGQLIKMGMNWRLGYVGAAVISAIAALVTVAALSMRMDKPVPSEDPSSDWKVIIRDRCVILFALGMMLYVAAEGGPASWLAVFFQRDLHSSAALAASSLSFFWFGILLGRVIAASISRYLSDLALIRGALVLSAIFQAVLLLLHAPIPAVAVTFLIGLFLAPLWPTIASMAGGAYPRQSGTVLGIVIASGSLGSAIFPPIMGWLSVFTGMRMALWSCVLILIAIIILFSRIPLRNAD